MSKRATIDETTRIKAMLNKIFTRHEEVEAEIPPRSTRKADNLGATRIPKLENIQTQYNSLLASTQTIYIRAVGYLNIETFALSGPPSRSSIGERHHIHITIGCPPILYGRFTWGTP